MLNWWLGEEEPGEIMHHHSIEAEIKDDGVLFNLVRDAMYGVGLDENSSQLEIDEVLYEASYNGDTTAVLDAIFLSGQPNFINEVGNTALHAAAAGGHVKVLELLLKGVDNHHKAAFVNQQGRWGNTPLHFCCGAKLLTESHVQCVELLLRNGADGLFRNQAKKSPHDMLRKKEHPIAQQISSMLDKELINLCPWLKTGTSTEMTPGNEDTGEVVLFRTMSPSSITSANDALSSSFPLPLPPAISRPSWTEPNSNQAHQNVCARHTAAAAAATTTTSTTASAEVVVSVALPLLTKETRQTTKEVKKTTRMTTRRKPLIQLAATELVVTEQQSQMPPASKNVDGNNNPPETSSSLIQLPVPVREANKSTFHMDDISGDIGDELSDGDFDGDNFGDGDDNWFGYDENDNEIVDDISDKHEYMTPTQILHQCRLALLSKSQDDNMLSVMTSSELEEWIDRLSDCRDDICENQLSSEVEVMLVRLESLLVETFVQSAKKAAAAQTRREGEELQIAESANVARTLLLSTPASTNSSSAATSTSTSTRRMEVLGTTVNNVARTLLGVPRSSSPPILPTTPQRRERVVVMVKPNDQGHGLCMQLDERLRVTAFRNIPGTEKQGHVECEGVERKDRLIRVNHRVVEGIDLDECLDVIKVEINHVGSSGRVEMEFVRIHLL